MIVILLLTLIVFLAFLLPVKPDKTVFDEKATIIATYREETKYLDSQHQKGSISENDKQALLNALDKQSALALLAIEQTPYHQRRAIQPIVLVGAMLLLTSTVYYWYFYESKGINAWQADKTVNSTAVFKSLSDDVFFERTLQTTNPADATRYCFLMQKIVLKQFLKDSAKLARLARCHRTLGYLPLAQTAAIMAVKADPTQVASLFLLADLELLRQNKLSDISADHLKSLTKKAEYAFGALKRLTADSLSKRQFQLTKDYLKQLKRLTPQDNNLHTMLKMIENEISPTASQQQEANVAEAMQ